jgi:hypothetical protein
VFTNEFFDDTISANFIHFKYMLTWLMSHIIIPFPFPQLCSDIPLIYDNVLDYAFLRIDIACDAACDAVSQDDRFDRILGLVIFDYGDFLTKFRIQILIMLDWCNLLNL